MLSIRPIIIQNLVFYAFNIRNSYLDTKKGPFIVYVSRETPDPAADTSIKANKFGQFLLINKILNITSDGVKNVGRNNISIKF